MPSAKLTSKGQITLPREVRELLAVDTGDRVDFVVRPSGEIVIEPATVDFLKLRGTLQRPERKSVSLGEMQEAVERGATRR